MKNILLIHGVFHTTNIFNSLIQSLSDYCICTTFFIQGLDNCEDTMSEYQIRLLKENICKNEYDLIIAHSYGAYLVLMSLERNRDVKVLLVNPLYKNMKNWLKLSIPLLSELSIIKKCIKYKAFRRLIYKIAELTCNDKSKIDDTLIEGIFTCNKNLYKLLSSMKYNCTLSNSTNLYLVWGIHDRLLKYPSAIASRCEKVYLINCGHSSFIEKEEYVIDVIKELIDLY